MQWDKLPLLQRPLLFICHAPSGKFLQPLVYVIDFICFFLRKFFFINILIIAHPLPQFRKRGRKIPIQSCESRGALVQAGKAAHMVPHASCLHALRRAVA
jgi:hypothetical protein